MAIAVLLIATASPAAAQQHWVASWGAAQQVPEPHNALPPADMADATLREIVHLSIGGPEVRVRFSNAFGTAPLVIDAAHIARAVKPGTSGIDPASDTALSFDGKPGVTIPAGAEYLSDPVAFGAAPGGNVAVSFHLPAAPAQQTGHPGSRSTSFVLHGDHVGDAALASAKTVEHWYQLSGIAVAAPADARTIVALGDSITDGHAATTDGDDRWPDVLAARLRADPATAMIGVVNAGIGGNRVLLDGLGPNLLARFERDVLARPGVRDVIVLEGVNDLGTLTREHPVSEAALTEQRERIIGAYRQIIDRAHAHGIRVTGATIMPFSGNDYYHPDAAVEADRQAINAWIRAPGHFDAVIDFDKVTRDPQHPQRLAPAMDSGDHLHPGPAGYAAMGSAVPLSLFGRRGDASGPEVAITFDDLPVHGPLPKGDSRVAIMARIAAALKAYGVPPTYGFTNGGFAAGEPASVPALDAWRAGGNVLANHTWSHMDLNKNSAAAWEADLLRNEAVIAPRMKGADWHWLRFPFLSEGDTPAKRTEVRRFLSDHHYKIASVTMSFGDYAWNEPYARCLAKGDDAAVARLKASYLRAAADTLAYAEAASQKVEGRPIPLVLLMHVGALDSVLLPKLLDFYKSQGVRFVSLAEAERDRFYAGDLDPASGTHPATLEAAAAAKGVALPPAPALPAELDTLCR
ncbi:MAG TPA: GDSL-type esterase/lipase family protein [Sphingomonas sp.]|nr:GDSL-type esterase/lipase family protein [Sphingomonas sp.]